jgi:hypothetical protein
VLHKGIDLLDQFLDAAEGASPDRTLGNQSEPAFHLIQLRSIGRRVMDVKPAGSLGYLNKDFAV